jgi:hypothetical protein
MLVIKKYLCFYILKMFKKKLRVFFFMLLRRCFNVLILKKLNKNILKNNCY